MSVSYTHLCTYRWTISDNGMGMSKEFLSHIFEPFVQEKNDARSIYQGTGLGMAIVKELINQMKGTIEISSEVGVGSTFVITIPFEIAPPPQKQQEKESTCSIEGMKLLMACLLYTSSCTDCRISVFQLAFRRKRWEKNDKKRVYF